MDKNTLESIIKISITRKEVIEKLGLIPSGANYLTINKYIKLWDLDISHFNPYKVIVDSLKKYREGIKTPLEDILVKNSSYKNRCSLKHRLYRAGIKQPICEQCGQDENWKGKKMSLILDHINGVYNDNRLENLQIVCPNCNATLDTHCGKNLRKQKEKKVKNERKTKISWPLKDDLLKLVWEKPTSTLCKELGVSDSAIAKQCKKLKIIKPPRGYWAKEKYKKL